MSRLFVGRLPAKATEKDLEKFFKGYGRIREVLMKNGYGFIEFCNSRDADDAVYDLNGKEMFGNSVLVEHARMPGSRAPMGRSRVGVPMRTEYRVVVENLSSRVSWQDLKDLMRKAGDVTYADAHKNHKNDGIVEFSTYDGMKTALSKFNDYELFGRRLKLYEERKGRQSSRSRSRSRSRSGGKRRKARRDSSSRGSSRHADSRSRSNSKDDKAREKPSTQRTSQKSGRSKEQTRSRSRDRARASSHRSASRSRSRSPSRSGDDGGKGRRGSPSPAGRGADRKRVASDDD